MKRTGLLAAGLTAGFFLSTAAPLPADDATTPPLNKRKKTGTASHHERRERKNHKRETVQKQAGTKPDAAVAAPKANSTPGPTAPGH